MCSARPAVCGEEGVKAGRFIFGRWVEAAGMRLREVIMWPLGAQSCYQAAAVGVRTERTALFSSTVKCCCC